MSENLVIVESPAKAKTIEKYLGRGYKVTASMGHLRDLPKSQIGVDIEHDFEPKYIPIKGKNQLISELKKESAKASVVYLATDPDREGEAISWHLKELLGLDDEKAKRVTFNEITKNVVTESIRHPRDIDMDLVDAQQARRILDRIVGYELSPLLWRKIKSRLSAGRVQSVATRLVVDKDEEIKNFVSEEFWHLDAKLTCGEGGFTARFYGKDGKEIKLRSREEVDAVINAVSSSPFTVETVKREEKQRSPAPPFTTSTLQQEASRSLNMSPKRTMAIAQQLYEGVEISGRGSVGLITYMRTDSLRLSDVALNAAKDYIIANFGKECYPPKTRTFKTKQSAQDAHEAIRPTDVALSPEVVRKDLTQEQYRLYRLIWRRFVACQMANAIYNSVTVDCVSAGYMFRAKYSEIKFKGFTAVYEESKEEESDELANPLPSLESGQTLALEKLLPEQQFTQPPAHYTEATLIRDLEKKGIGRPSTYAPTVSSITARDYVMKEGKYLRSTPLGEVVTAFMKEHFPDIVDYKFTEQMEDRLDKIEHGDINWKEVLGEFYKDFESEMTKAESELDGVKIKVPDVLSDEYCEVCGRQMVKKKGKFGYFLACPGFPECTFTKPIVIVAPGKCPKCGGRILKRTSKAGHVFYACERGQEACGFSTWDVPTENFCPTCGKTLFKPSGRGPLKTFCINEECASFVPEENRRYKKKSPEETATAEAKKAEKADKKEKKTAAKKTTAAKKKTTTAKASAAKKTTAAKSAAKKKTAAKSTATKKTAAKKTTAKKSSEKAEE